PTLPAARDHHGSASTFVRVPRAVLRRSVAQSPDPVGARPCSITGRDPSALSMLGLSGGPGGGVVTVWDLLAVAARRWVVIVVGALVTAGLVLQVWTIPGVYHQEVNVLFLMPDRPQDTNRPTSVSDSLISFAGVVERVMNADARGSRVVSEEVNLATTGVRAGYSV